MLRHESVTHSRNSTDGRNTEVEGSVNPYVGPSQLFLHILLRGSPNQLGPLPRRRGYLVYIIALKILHPRILKSSEKSTRTTAFQRTLPSKSQTDISLALIPSPVTAIVVLLSFSFDR